MSPACPSSDKNWREWPNFARPGPVLSSQFEVQPRANKQQQWQQQRQRQSAVDRSNPRKAPRVVDPLPSVQNKRTEESPLQLCMNLFRFLRSTLGLVDFFNNALSVARTECRLLALTNPARASCLTQPTKTAGSPSSSACACLASVGRLPPQDGLHLSGNGLQRSGPKEVPSSPTRPHSWLRLR